MVTIRFNTGTVSFPWLDDNTYEPIPETLNYMAANGVEVKDSINGDVFTDTAVAAAQIQWYRDIYRDYGIKVWCHCENQMDNTEVMNPNWLIADYETNFGECLDLFLAEGSYMVGFSYEAANDEGAQWLYNRAHAAGKKVSSMIWSTDWQTQETPEWRLQFLDELIYELWELALVDNLR